MSPDAKQDAAPRCKEGMDQRDIHRCPNMKALPQDFRDDYEQYECPVCGQRYKIYDEEIR